MIRIALWIAPFRWLQRQVARRSRMRSTRAFVAPERIVWAVRATARRVPRATCLTQALAGKLLLEQNGCPVELRIGVGRDDAGQFRAHAWLERDGRSILGDPQPEAFVPFPPIAW